MRPMSYTLDHGDPKAVVYHKVNADVYLKVVRSDCKHFFFRLEKTELDYDTGIFMRLCNVKNFVSAVLSTKIQL